MSLVYIFAASGMEGQPVRRMAAPSDSDSTLHCGPNNLVLVISGMGAGNARSKAEAMLRSPFGTPAGNRPDAVMIIGLCGGLTESLPEKKIVLYAEYKSIEASKPPLRCSDAIANSFTKLLTGSGIPCDRVVGITSTRLATMPDQRLALANLGAAAVDMESYSILETAAAAGIPSIVLRVVSDAVKRKLPDFNLALNDDGSLDGRKALKIALASPLLTAQLLLANIRAMRHLGKALEIVLKAPCFA
jgi:nucleoside phosphorylase